MDIITRQALNVVFQAAMSDVKADIIADIFNKPGTGRESELNQLDTLKRLETRLNARIECYIKPDGTE